MLLNIYLSLLKVEGNPKVIMLRLIQNKLMLSFGCLF